MTCPQTTSSTPRRATYGAATAMLVVTLAAGCGKGGVSHSQNPDSSSALKIYGGTEVAPGQWNNVVAIAYKRDGSFYIECTGTLIAPNVVLTAGHCVEDFLESSGTELRAGMSWEDVAVVTGSGFEGRKIPEDTPLFQVKHGFVHHMLRVLPRGNADLGLLVLANDITDVDQIPMLADYKESAVLTAAKAVATLVGYGRREDNGIGRKFEVSLPILERQGAEALLGGDGKDSCNVDSGGPVFAQLPPSKNSPQPAQRLVGVISRGINLSCGSGGIITLTPDYICWIEDKLGMPFGSARTNHGCGLPDEVYSDEQLQNLDFLSLCKSKRKSPLQQHTVITIKHALKARTCDAAAAKLDEATSLDLGGMRIRDLSPLANVPNLRTLTLSANKITDASVLRSMKSLMTVDLSYNDIVDLSGLDAMVSAGLEVRGRHLQVSTFRNTRFSELCDNPEATPEQQETVRTIRSRLRTGDCAEASLLLAREREFRIAHRDVTDLTPFSRLENLIELDLKGNPVSDISPLASCENLKVLDLTGTNVTDISPLVELLARGLEIRRGAP